MVSLSTKNANGRISRDDRSEKGESDQKQREDDIGPRVKRPLTGPVNGQPIGKRSEVQEWPNVISAGPAGADHIAKEVNVRDDKADDEHTYATYREERQRQRNRYRRRETMEQRVVVLPVVPRVGPAQHTIYNIDHQTQPVGVG